MLFIDVLSYYNVDNYLLTLFFSPAEDEEVGEGQEDAVDEDDAVNEEISDDAEENIPGRRIFTFLIAKSWSYQMLDESHASECSQS